jgi:hypothetical protein
LAFQFRITPVISGASRSKQRRLQHDGNEKVQVHDANTKQHHQQRDENVDQVGMQAARLQRAQPARDAAGPAS